MSAVDRRRLDMRLERIEIACTKLDQAARAPFDRYANDPNLVDATERRIQVALQAAIDVGAHIISASGWKTPEDYRNVFTELAAHSVLPNDLAARLADAAGLRNLLVHEYLEIDAKRLHSGLGADVGDLRAFGAATITWLDGTAM